MVVKPFLAAPDVDALIRANTGLTFIAAIAHAWDITVGMPLHAYRTIGEKYGVKYSEDEILMRYRQAYSQPWGKSRLRYVDDGRPFWQHIVSSSTGWTLNLSLQSSTKILL
ncbi:hypothetical protein ZWY2020_051879 [Hordeum vulgare]|nr:hypothetical protein ZWY2020_051879 [Hordeum vulgare]